MTVQVRLNPNLKDDVIKAAEQALGAKITTEKQALEALQRGEKLSNKILTHLASKSLIEVQDITNLDSPAGERELLFTFFTERGRALLEN